jgi:hypothetical protein
VGGRGSERIWWLAFRDLIPGEVLDGTRSLLLMCNSESS